MYVSKDKDFLLHCLSPSLVACMVGMTMPSSRAVVSKAREGLHQDLNGSLVYNLLGARHCAGTKSTALGADKPRPLPQPQHSPPVSLGHVT